MSLVLFPGPMIRFIDNYKLRVAPHLPDHLHEEPVKIELVCTRNDTFYENRVPEADQNFRIFRSYWIFLYTLALCVPSKRR